MGQFLGLWVGQSLKLNRKTCFHGSKSFLVVNSHIAKPDRLILSKMLTSTFYLSKGDRMTTLANQLAAFEYNFRCLEWFFSKMSGKLSLAFLLKL